MTGVLRRWKGHGSLVLDRRNRPRRCGGGAWLVGIEAREDEFLDVLVDDRGADLPDRLPRDPGGNARGVPASQHR